MFPSFHFISFIFEMWHQHVKIRDAYIVGGFYEHVCAFWVVFLVFR